MSIVFKKKDTKKGVQREKVVHATNTRIKVREVVQEGESVLGNTIPKRVRVNPYNGWCYTFNNYTESDVVQIFSFMRESSEYFYAVSKEIAPTTGTPHLQGYIALKDKKKKMRWDSLGFSTNIKWIAAKGTPQQNHKYISKGKEFLTNIKVKRPLIKESLTRQWQTDLETELLTTIPDFRTIHWYWSKHGKKGKSTFVRYMIDAHDVGMINKGSHADMINQFYNFGDNTPDILLINIPKDMKRISYAALEDIKDGVVNNSKYETGRIRFNPPHIVVFCNFPIEEGHFSNDRIKMVCLDDVEDLEPVDLAGQLVLPQAQE